MREVSAWIVENERKFTSKVFEFIMRPNVDEIGKMISNHVCSNK